MIDKKMREIIAHKDTRKNNGPLQKSEPSGSVPSVFRDSTESGSYPTGSKPETVESIGFRRCCNTTIVDLLLLGKTYIDLSEDSISALDFKSYLTQDEARAQDDVEAPRTRCTSIYCISAIAYYDYSGAAEFNYTR